MTKELLMSSSTSKNDNEI